MSGPPLAYVTLALVPGIGRARLDALLARFGTPERALEAAMPDLLDVPGITRAAATAIRSANLAAAERLVARTDALGGVLIVPDDARFPRAYRHIPDPPTLLFAVGRLELADAPAVAIVGSRTHTRYGADVCRFLAGGAARAGLTVVSGMARGIDALAHGAALDAGGGTVGILGNGFGVVYPSANRALYDRVREHGLMLTEFPPGERPHAGSFPRRNRLISGLARATVVVEAREKSGALITVDCALAQGRDVLAVPGPVTSPSSIGCNRLIQSGAKPLLGIRDLLEEYGLEPVPPVAPSRPDLPAFPRQVLAALDQDACHADHLAERLDRDVADVLAVLTDLELAGLVDALPGKVYRKVVAQETMG